MDEFVVQAVTKLMILENQTEAFRDKLNEFRQALLVFAQAKKLNLKYKHQVLKPWHAYDVKRQKAMAQYFLDDIVKVKKWLADYKAGLATLSKLRSQYNDSKWLDVATRLEATIKKAEPLFNRMG